MSTDDFDTVDNELDAPFSLPLEEFSEAVLIHQEAKLVAPELPTVRAELDAINTGFEHMRSNKINQLGLGPKVIEYKRDGYSLAQIAGFLNVGHEQVITWWHTFEGLSPKQRRAFTQHMHRDNNIFDIATTLQSLANKLEDFGDSMERDNPQLYLESLKEMRQLVKVVKDCGETFINAKRRKEETDVFTDEIRKADDVKCPKCAHAFKSDIANRITKRIKAVREGRAMLS